MRSSKKTLTLALLLQLVPVTIVAWIGLRELGRLEDEVGESLSRGKQAALARIEESLSNAIDRVVSVRTADLDNHSIADLIATLASTPRPGEETLCSVLFASDGEPVFPKRPPSGGTTPSLSPINPNRPGVGDFYRVLREAEVLASLQRYDDACEHLTDWDAPRNLPTEVAVRLAFERGRLLRKIGRRVEAMGELREAERLTASLPVLQRGRAGTAALLLLTRFMLLDTEAQLIGLARQPSFVESGLDLLRTIARGDYDAESDAWLDRIFARTRGLVQAGLADAAPGARAELDILIEQRSWHVEQRNLVATLVERDLGALADPDRRRLTLTWKRSTAAAFIAFSRLPSDLDGDIDGLWIAHRIDVNSVVQGIAAEVEERLGSEQGGYRLTLLDAAGRRIYGTGTSFEDAQETGPSTLDATSRLAFTGTLAGIIAELRPENPLLLTQMTRRTILTKSVLLVALAVIASVGAFLLIRTLRREAELAGLRTEFVSRISHELKTPLSLIRMYGETLALGRVSDPDKAIDFARVISKESARLTEMIDRILDLSKIDADTKSYDPRPTRIDLLVADVVETYRGHLASQGFEIHFDHDGAIEVLVDPDGLNEALINLLSNAAKYHEGGDEKRIDVSLAEGANDVCLRVRDRGMGIPKSERERIFDTFYRSPTAGERRGAGIGLALVKHFVDAHGGSCRCVDNDDGDPRGSTFELRLPKREHRET